LERRVAAGEAARVRGGVASVDLASLAARRAGGAVEGRVGAPSLQRTAVAAGGTSAAATMSNSSWDSADSTLEDADQFGADPYAESSAEYDPFESPDYVDDASLPTLKASHEARGGGNSGMEMILGVDAAMANAVGRANQATRGEEFLSYQKRGWFERATYATGMCYMAGIGLGGARGFVTGLANSPSPRLRVRVNSILNGCGRGARLGNSLGVLAMMFTCWETVFDTVEVDKHVRLPGSDWLSPVLAASATGVVFRGTAGAGVAALSGVVGGVVGAVWFVGVPRLLYQFPQLGDLVPGRR